MIVPLHTMNRYHFDSPHSTEQRASIRRVWYPSNRILGSRVVPSSLSPVFPRWLHHWIGVTLSHQGYHRVSCSLPERQLLSVCALLVCTHICPCPCRADTRSSAGVSIVCAQSQPSTLRCVTTAARSQSCRGYIHHGNWCPGGYNWSGFTLPELLFHTLCNYLCLDAVIAELL